MHSHLQRVWSSLCPPYHSSAISSLGRDGGPRDVRNEWESTLEAGTEVSRDVAWPTDIN